MDEACYAIAFVICGFFVYSRFREVQCERFENKITTRKYTLKELCELLQIIKNTLQKGGDEYHLIDVRMVEFTMTGASAVFTAFNRTKWTTKIYKGYVSRGGSSADITENMISFDESYVENKAFGRKMGMHDSEALRAVPFLNSDVASLSRYTFTREALAPAGGEEMKVVGVSEPLQMKVKTRPPPLPGTDRSVEDLVLASTTARYNHNSKKSGMPDSSTSTQTQRGTSLDPTLVSQTKGTSLDPTLVSQTKGGSVLSGSPLKLNKL